MNSQPIAAPESVSLVIAGGGKISENLVVDLLDDWLRLDTKEQVDYRIYLPGDVSEFTDAVKAAALWAKTKAGFCTVVDGSDPSPVALSHVGEGNFRVNANECELSVASTLLTVLMEDFAQEKRTPFVLLAWGAQDDPPDDFTAELFSGAIEAGITVLEMADRGLEELSVAEPVAEEPTQDSPSTVVNEPEASQEESGDEGQQSVPSAAQERVSAPEAHPVQDVWDLPETLERCYRLLRDEDFFIALADRERGDEAPESKLTRSLRAHLAPYLQLRETVDAAVAEMTPASTPSVEVTLVDPEPDAPRGRARAGDGEVTVLLSTVGRKALAAGQTVGPEDWRKNTGGRPRTGWVRQTVRQELLAS